MWMYVIFIWIKKQSNAAMRMDVLERVWRGYFGRVLVYDEKAQIKINRDGTASR